MINNHLSSVEKRCLSANDAQSIQVIHSTYQTINQFASDVQFGITGSVESNSMANLEKNPNQFTLKHDLEVLKRMVEATHLTNAIVSKAERARILCQIYSISSKDSWYKEPIFNRTICSNI